MTKFGVVGYKGKIGSLLVERPDFVPVDCDVRILGSIHDGLKRVGKIDILINCAAISSVDQCEADYRLADAVNFRGVGNLITVFGDKVLSFSTDQVFDGNGLFLPKENTKPNPVNYYGLTKFASEGFVDGKVIRISRAVSLFDPDIANYLTKLALKIPVHVPTFFSRNYLHKNYMADGVEYFVRNWDKMPKLVNYAGGNVVNMHNFVSQLAKRVGLDPRLVIPNNEYVENDQMIPRPKHGGLNIGLARRLGFPIYTISDTVEELVREYMSNGY